MLNFELYTPTRVIFGKGTEKKVGDLLKCYNASKALVHYYGDINEEQQAVLDRVCGYLNDVCIPYVKLGGVTPNPRLSKVYEGVELCLKENVDFILALGGGSVIDSAKAIGYGVASGGDVWDYYKGIETITGCLPIGCILTIPAAGSEMGASSVISNEEEGMKMGVDSDYGICRFAILNPEITYTLPPYQTGCGCADVLQHTMERFFSNETMELTDQLSEALMRTVIKSSRILVSQPRNYEARAQIMWAGSLSHNGLMACGTDGGDWSSHQLSEAIGATFDTTHGSGLTAVWDSWARYVYKSNTERFAQLATNVFNIPNSDNLDEMALLGIEAVKNFHRCIGMPVNISELGLTLTDEQLEALAYKCSYGRTRTIGIIRELDFDDILKIYKMAR
ncbi:MAG: iron-containing alcohol dehydrogenase [Oscillospiraceae bacterium]|nr:iron-containing alcohol dehydrogenase [Oscillospiraceae bacterium]